MKKWNNAASKKFILTSVVFILSMAICIGVTYAYVQNEMKLETVKMEQLALTKSNKVGAVLEKLLFKTQTLSTLVIQGNGEVEDFERTAATIMDDPCIANLILAPDGIVSMVYPLEGNEEVLGLNYFSEQAGNLEAIQARDSNQLVLGGPFELVQGGQAIVGRLPVYLTDADGNDYFWGMVSVTLKYPEALAGAELEQLKEQGFAFEIWRINPDTGEKQIIANSNYKYDKNTKYVEQKLDVLNAEWYFRISPIRNWYQIPETWFYLLVGTILSLLVVFLVRYNLNLQEMKKHLEDLSVRDALTGALNRRGVFQLLEAMISRPNSKFLLCYIDINNFKEVNDYHGHGAGDQALMLIAETFNRRCGRGDKLGRIGGDEFVLLCKNSSNEAYLTNIIQLVREDLKQGQLSKKLNISFSVGYVRFPDDGRTADELLSQADTRMYMEKSNQKNDSVNCCD